MAGFGRQYRHYAASEGLPDASGLWESRPQSLRSHVLWLARILQDAQNAAQCLVLRRTSIRFFGFICLPKAVILIAQSEGLFPEFVYSGYQVENLDYQVENGESFFPNAKPDFPKAAH